MDSHRQPFPTTRTARTVFILTVAVSLWLQLGLLLSPTSISHREEHGNADDSVIDPILLSLVNATLSGSTPASASQLLSQPQAILSYPNYRTTLQWTNGCLSSVPWQARKLDEPDTTPTIVSNPPKGIVVTIALAPKHRQHLSQGRDQICNNLPNQWQWFLHPQGMDMLLVIQDEDKRWNTKRFARCLNLSKNHTAGTGDSGITKTWYNFDGTKLVTTEYNYTNTLAGRTSSIRIFLATTFVQYPRYIRQNMTRLEDRKNGPPGCSARLRYLQGCRWYTQEMLHLSILQEYDYFLKMDTDIIFRKSPSFHLLQDMQNKRAVFAHAAEYHPVGDGSCAPGILTAMKEFIREVNDRDSSNKDQQYSWSDPRLNATTRASVSLSTPPPPQWKKQVCSSSSPEIQRDADQYYGNFLIGKVEYFTSPWLLEFATFLSEYPHGFFQNKWGDQIFWHFAMGVLLDQDFAKYVVDYTDLRCKPDPNCWYSVFDTEKYGPAAAEQCSGDLGLFVHSKSLDFVQRVKAVNYSFHPALPKTSEKAPFEPLFESSYKHCPA